MRVGRACHTLSLEKAQKRTAPPRTPRKHRSTHRLTEIETILALRARCQVRWKTPPSSSCRFALSSVFEHHLAVSTGSLRAPWQRRFAPLRRQAAAKRSAGLSLEVDSVAEVRKSPRKSSIWK